MIPAERFVNVRPDFITVRLGDEVVLRFDLEGRWFSVSLGETLFRRGLDHRVLVRGRPRRGRRSEGSRWLEPGEVDALSRDIHERAREAVEEARRGLLPVKGGAAPPGVDAALAAVTSWDGDRYARQAALFRETYGRIAVLPPDLYLSLVVQVARGCPYNRCSFCTLYQGVPFEALGEEAFEEHLDRVGRFMGKGMLLRRGIFLGDANALALPATVLADRMAAIRRRFVGRHPAPGLPDQMHAFQDTFSEPDHSAQEYGRLARLGLRRVYVGLESGNDPVRRLLAKPGRAAQAADAIRRIRAAGISVGIMVLAGAGGVALARGHERDTTALLRDLGLDASDRVFLSPLAVAPGAPYTARLEALGSEPADPSGIEAEIARFRAALSWPGGPKVGRYRVEDFVPY